MKIIILLLCSILIAPLSFGASTKCKASFAENHQPKKLEKNESNFELVRRTAPHFWQWSQKADTELDKAGLLIIGSVSGDPHILNFGWAYSAKRFSYALLDMDDAGRAPLILDAIRLFVATKSLNPTINISESMRAYEQGLSGKVPKIPKFLIGEYSEAPKYDLKKFEELSKLKDA